MLTFAAVALAELGTFMLVESWIGLGPTLLIALSTAVLGSILVKRAGLQVWSDFQRRLATGALPTRELSHGASILVAGAFLISPGFITDALGFLLLVPAVRDRIHTLAGRRIGRRVTVVGTTRVDTTVIDAEGWEVSEEETWRGQLP